MHYAIQQELARAHQADLLREAERHRLALLVRGGTTQRRWRPSFLAHLRFRRPQRRPAPAV
jgi:hypothetical protein